VEEGGSSNAGDDIAWRLVVEGDRKKKSEGKK
jgi:hypothetical protein